MRLFGLIGYPLGHSFSKRYFTQKFLEESVSDARYELFPLENIDLLPQLIADHPDLVGLNVTIPYKEQVIPYLDDASALSGIGACNCIHIREGKLYGYNTDVIGFRESFQTGLKPWNTHALILGTGGASKAVAYTLRQAGIHFRYVSRNPTDPDIFSYAELNAALLGTYTILINCSPVGTFPNIDEAPALPYEALSSRHYLFDLVYNPEKTRFLKEGETRGVTIRNGYDMLRIQAEEAYKLWTGGGRGPRR